MTREEFEQYAKENGLVVWSKEMSEKAIKALKQEPTTKNNLGFDCIDRNRAIERLKLNFPSSDGADNSRDRHRYMQALADLQAIRELPSATPQEPCDKCEVGNPCLYCKHEFEPQESEDKQ